MEHSFTTRDESEFWAHIRDDRAGQPLREHLAVVSDAAREHTTKVGLGRAGATIGLLHDLGKYSRAFQSYLKQIAISDDSEERGRIDHSTAGAQTIWQALRERGPREAVVAEILALCVASHHSGLIDCIDPEGRESLKHRIRKADADSHLSEVRAKAERAVCDKRDQLLNDPGLIDEIAGVIAGICRNDHHETIRRFKAGLLVRFLFGCLIDADRTDTADWSSPGSAALRQRGHYPNWSRLADRLEEYLRRLGVHRPIDLLRQRISDECHAAATRVRGVFTLTVPTGGGKTLASLRFALAHAANWELDRIIYISPYTSIIDQNAAAARQVLETDASEFANIVLEHHSNLTPQKQTWRSKVLSENWDAPVVFTTAVQVLEALFGSGTRAVRRMHQMAKAILVFDEIQTLPVRCVHLFNNAVNFLVEQCGSTVVLCTATQPLLHEVDAKKGALRLGENAELAPEAGKWFEGVRRVTVYDRRKPGGWAFPDVARLAQAEVESTGSCLAVVNTKREARLIFQQCEALGDIPVFHLSTAMCPAHRLAALMEIRARLDVHVPLICVSTQLIEAGVDISFGSCIRDLAGIDSIAQVGGRCNRHGERPMGRVLVINLKGEIPKRLREIRAAREAAQRVLDENGSGNGVIDLADPRLIRDYFRYYFFERRQEMDYPVGPEGVGREDTLLSLLSENRQAIGSTRPTLFLMQSFMTAAEAFQAIDRSTQGVIVPYAAEGKDVIAALCAAKEPLQQTRLLKSAQRFTVNVFPEVLRKLQQRGAVHEIQEGTGVLYLDASHYSGAFGLNEEGFEEMEAAIV